MKKNELTCSAAMTGLLASVPDDADIGSIAVFVGVKGGGVFMGSHMAASPEQMAAMISAFGEAKRSVVEGIIREHGMDTMVTVMFFLASNHPDAKQLGNDPADFLRNYFVPRGGEGG